MTIFKRVFDTHYDEEKQKAERQRLEHADPASAAAFGPSATMSPQDASVEGGGVAAHSKAPVFSRPASVASDAPEPGIATPSWLPPVSVPLRAADPDQGPTAWADAASEPGPAHGQHSQSLSVAAHPPAQEAQTQSSPRPGPPGPQSLDEGDAFQSVAARAAQAVQAMQSAGPAPSDDPDMRARTRLLGFGNGAQAVADPFAEAPSDDATPTGLFPTGWLVIVDGPGRGNALTIHDGVSTIGRGPDQGVVLDFGDTSISRQHHAAIAYDREQNRFFIGHGGKSNIIRLNNRPVLSTEDLNHADLLRIGETTLRFVSLCDAEFQWEDGDCAA